MFEKVSPAHPDKLADRIAGAMVDLAYRVNPNARMAVEVLIGHGKCFIMTEGTEWLHRLEVQQAVDMITPGICNIQLIQNPQDKHLADNQTGGIIRCADNGIFRGEPITEEQIALTDIADTLWNTYGTDGKYLSWGDGNLTLCQSQVKSVELEAAWPQATINPLGEWTGGPDVDAGVTNRKLGSDMGASAVGGGLHGKDLTKADVSVNIYAWLKAQALKQPVEISCSIGDEIVDGRPYQEIVDIAKTYITLIGGFEEFAKWGLIRPSSEWFSEKLLNGYLYV